MSIAMTKLTSNWQKLQRQFLFGLKDCELLFSFLSLLVCFFQSLTCLRCQDRWHALLYRLDRSSTGVNYAGLLAWQPVYRRQRSDGGYPSSVEFVAICCLPCQLPMSYCVPHEFQLIMWVHLHFIHDSTFILHCVLSTSCDNVWISPLQIATLPYK